MGGSWIRLGIFLVSVWKPNSISDIFSSSLGGMRKGRVWVALQGENIPLDGARAVAGRQLGASYIYTTTAMQSCSNISALLRV